jgi:hypothetical protein
MRRSIPHGCVARRFNSPAIRPPRALKTKQNLTQIYAPTREGYFVPVPKH